MPSIDVGGAQGKDPGTRNRSWVMSEFMRSSAIILMGLSVMAAGVVVVFYS